MTNAVLCNPRDEKGRNTRPARVELDACRDHLVETLRVVDPQFVVTLGRVALESTRRIAPHGLELSDAGGPFIDWQGRRLGVLYHPSARSAIHRSWRRQQNDARRLGHYLRVLAEPS